MALDVPEITQEDWALCRDVVREHGKTFFFASSFLPSNQRNAIHAAYAWCRIADDIVDRAPATGIDAAEAALDAWECELDDPQQPVARAYWQVRREFGIVDHASRDLIAGIRMDLAPGRFSTWDDLEVYCYRVAGTVGLISAPILGCRDTEALPRAVDLGIAMQITNILRDVGEDGRMGRLYLPLEDLATFDVDPEATLAGRPSGRFRELMEFEVARARGYYASARLGVPSLSRAGQMATLASARLYGKILDRIEQNDYDVFQRRAVVDRREKFREIPAIAGDFFLLQVPPIRS